MVAYLILYHVLCLLGVLVLYIGSHGTVYKKMSPYLKAVYAMVALVIGSDMMWGIVSEYGCHNIVTDYLINIIYFSAEMLGVYLWYVYTVHTLKAFDLNSKLVNTVIVFPVFVILLLTVSTPWTHAIFRIENGEYIRGELFYFDTIIKLGYILLTCLYGFGCVKLENKKYLRKRDLLIGIYGVPIIVAGILQSLTGADFNCIGTIFGLAILYLYGLNNTAMENSDIVMAIAKSYDGAYMINADDHTIRTIYINEDYIAKLKQMSDSVSYEERVRKFVDESVAPEDRITVEVESSVENILKKLEDKNTYSFVYKILNKNNEILHNKMTFMKAFSKDEKLEIFLGVSSIETRQIFIEETEKEREHREQLEKVKESLTNVIANVIEARDTDSGEHVLRVKTYTQMIANRVMEDYPKYGLDAEKIRYITAGSALHDIGKIMIPDAILLKPGKLTDDEFAIMKTHCARGCEVLNMMPADLDREYIKYANEICRWHHEKFDGQGYPDGLAGNEIPVSAQIVALADCFDALTTKRVYKDAYSKQEAFLMIVSGKCGVFNPELIKSFERVYVTKLKDD